MSVLATRENVIRVQFSKELYISNLLESDDGGDVSHYSVSTVAGTVGLDNVDVHAVAPVHVEPTDPDTLDAGAVAGQFVDLVLDRPMSLWPCRYTLSIALPLKATDGEPLFNPFTGEVAAVFKLIDQPSLDVATPSRDIANPQTRQAMFDPLPFPDDPLALGTIGVDDTGDYAFDEGIVSLKKRIYRRLTSRPAGFAHLPRYGVGIPQHGKKLAQAAVIQQLVGEAEKQLSEEPEIAKVKVSGARDLNTPGLIRFIVLARTKSGGGLRVDAPFSLA